MKEGKKTEKQFCSKTKTISIPIEEQIIGIKVKVITYSKEHKELLMGILWRKIIIPLNLSWNGRAKCHKNKMSEKTENGSKRRKISIDSHSTSQTETGTKMPNQSFSFHQTVHLKLKAKKFYLWKVIFRTRN
jgi:hypothetical protein